MTEYLVSRVQIQDAHCSDAINSNLVNRLTANLSAISGPFQRLPLKVVTLPLERGIVTQREHKWGLEEATEYFSGRNQREGA